MKKTYLKPNALVVKVEPQRVIALSMVEGQADMNKPVYSREARFSDWDEEEE